MNLKVPNAEYGLELPYFITIYDANKKLRPKVPSDGKNGEITNTFEKPSTLKTYVCFIIF